MLGPLEPGPGPEEVREQARKLASLFLAEEWLAKKGRRFPQGRDLRIAGGVNVQQRVHKAPGGPLRATLVLQEGCLEQVSLSGDWRANPPRWSSPA